MSRGLTRIVMHWTAGPWSVTTLDLRHYHLIVDGDGQIHEGTHLPEANRSTKDGNYAAHTRALNTGSIGIAVAGMHGAQERPFVKGPYPLNHEQMRVFYEAVADMADTYRIPITPKTVLTHAEVQPALGVRQRGKWDITWLPGMLSPGDPIAIGDAIRERVRAVLDQPRKHAWSA